MLLKREYKPPGLFKRNGTVWWHTYAYVYKGPVYIELEKECPICFDANGRFPLLDCGHVFCIECLERFFNDEDRKELPTCPMGCGRKLNDELIEQHIINTIKMDSPTEKMIRSMFDHKDYSKNEMWEAAKIETLSSSISRQLRPEEIDDYRDCFDESQTFHFKSNEI